MHRSDLKELHYIAAIENVVSILKHGILSHNRAVRVPHLSIAMQEMQDRRAHVVVPGGRKLHDYVNLYICARNPMLFKRLSLIDQICVLRVDTGVLDIPGVVVTDSNASGDYVRFASAPHGLLFVDQERTFAEYWTDPDPLEYYRKKAAKCAEVLIPDRVPPEFIIGVVVGTTFAKTALDSLETQLDAQIHRHLFFR